jgi:hypothetical protein
MNSDLREKTIQQFERNVTEIENIVYNKIVSLMLEKQTIWKPEDIVMLKTFISMNIVDRTVVSQLNDEQLREDFEKDAGIFSEPCPICGAPVPAVERRSCICTNGHFWNRCQLSGRIVTGNTYLCQKNQSKRMIPDTPFLEEISALFEYCIYCGARMYLEYFK